jgi:hypothetical protein
MKKSIPELRVMADPVLDNIVTKLCNIDAGYQENGREGFWADLDGMFKDTTRSTANKDREKQLTDLTIKWFGGTPEIDAYLYEDLEQMWERIKTKIKG